MKEIKGSFQGKGKKIALIVSRFNEFIGKELLSSCVETLTKCGVDDSDISVAWVPGSYEMPLVARKLAVSKKCDAVICLGAVIRGETPHFDYIASSVSRGLSQVSLDTGIPVIFGIITADTQEQAMDRAGLKQGNKGHTAALSALELVNLLLKAK
ncbi:MAG: 6,7-dimethyl-8-ribityllumazine synthase [Candidatus Omnitrophica bacterium]|nr:6,7-dimethyl-8-ribityllumazine synthase [Candidatus Omnitrophota bacterium]